MLAAARLIDTLDVPHWVMENVFGVLKSPEWLQTQTFLGSKGYTSRDLHVNANHCGVPQTRERIFVVGSKTASRAALDDVAEQATEWAAAGPDTPERAAQFARGRRPSMHDAIDGLLPAFWMRARNMTDACVRSSHKPVSTVLTYCTGKPRVARRRRRGHKLTVARRYAHARRDADAADVDAASILTVAQWGVAQGFPFTYRWHVGQRDTSRTAAGIFIGNAVPPLVMRSVGRWIVEAGFVPSEWVKGLHTQQEVTGTAEPSSVARPTIPKCVAVTQTEAIRGLLALQRVGTEASTVFASWARAQLAASTTIVDGKKVLLHWALATPRYLQSPLLGEWRRRQREAGKSVPNAAQERASGLGDRNGADDDRPFLRDDPGLTGRVWARVRRGESYTGMTQPITGRPNRFWREWERSGASGDILKALRDGAICSTLPRTSNLQVWAAWTAEAMAQAFMTQNTPRGCTARSRNWWLWT